MLSRLELHNFKAFRRFTVTFRQQSFLVGPNNAGKSTVIAALRTGAEALRLARAHSAGDREIVDGVVREGHRFTGERVGLVEENLRHEFHPGETKLVFHFGRDLRVAIRWPESDDDELPAAFCTLQHQGVALTRPAQVRRVFPAIGIVPVLAPIEFSETALSPDHVRANAERRLASRHARNHLYLLQQEPSEDAANAFEEFRRFAQPWISELTLRELAAHPTDEGVSIDLYYSEPGGRHPKEVFWAGDGMQIWIQLLAHLFRLRDADLIVLDEPDLFLHADMQRRLVALLDTLGAQVITATHSAEVLAEARPDSVVWISRNRRRSVRAPGPEAIVNLTSALGTQFNLRLARALRARAVVFVEGDDTKLLRNLGATVGTEAIAKEERLVTISLKGVDRWRGVEPFSWMLSELLEKSVSTWVLLDRDYRTPEAVVEIEKQLSDAGTNPHVWERHELESYLVSIPAISRLTGLAEAEVAALLDESLASLEDRVLAGLTREAAHATDVTKASLAAQRRFKSTWKDRESRIAVAPGKELISAINRCLQARGEPTVSDRTLSQELGPNEIPAELKRVLRGIEKSVSA